MNGLVGDPLRGPQVLVDSVDVGNDGRPAVSQDELQNYVKALAPLWAETCEQDAVEVANGECLVPLDTENFDLSECMAIFGMCLREHCGTSARPPHVCISVRVRFLWRCESAEAGVDGRVVHKQCFRPSRGGERARWISRSLALGPRF